MKRNSKLAILIVLITAALFVWIPKGRDPTAVSTNMLSAVFDDVIPSIRKAPRKRTGFVDWPRDPFAKPQVGGKGKKAYTAPNLKVGAIIWDDKNPSAFINGEFVNVGDKVEDKTVTKIERDRVVLTDGTNEYVLKLQE